MDDTRNYLEFLANPSNWGGIKSTPTKNMEQPIAFNNKDITSILPPFIRGSEFPEQFELEKRPPLVDGLFRVKDNVLLGAPPKMGKSWFYSTLACSLTSGTNFLDLETRKSKVLLIDLELHRDDCLDRLWSIALSQGLKKVPDDLWVWCLRDYEYDLDLLINELDIRIDQMGGVDAIILDPIYMLGDLEFDENNANSVKNFLRAIALLKQKNNSALLLTHHFSKGTKGRESHQDRFSGSGAFQRWPDSLITLTPHQKEGNGIMEVTGRSMPKFPASVIKVSPPDLRATDLNVEFRK